MNHTQRIVRKKVIFFITFVSIACSFFSSLPYQTSPIIIKRSNASDTPTRYIIINPSLIPSTTLTPTITSQPTSTTTATNTTTPTLIPSNTFPPSLTPIYLLYQKSKYQLSTWSFQEAIDKLALIENYSSSLISSKVSRKEYTALNLAVALLINEITEKYPDQITIDLYGKYIYYLARAEHPLAADHFSKLITTLLNKKIVTINNLSVWLQSRHQGLSYNTYSIPALPTSDEAYILHISEGGNCIFLLLKSNARFSVIPLYVKFDFIDPCRSYFLLEDINKDNYPEIILYSISTSNYHHLSLPLIFDISHKPYHTIPFNKTIKIPIGMPYNGKWFTKNDPDGNLFLVFQGSMFPLCPVFISATFVIKNEKFEMTEIHYQVTPQNGLQGYCTLVLEHAKNNWETTSFIEIAEQLLPLWPPPPLPNGELFSLNAKDELIFNLGIAQALIGNYEKARDYLKTLSSIDTLTKNPYIENAELFLTFYKQPKDIYQSCRELFLQQATSPSLPRSDNCDLKKALYSLFSLYNSQDQYNSTDGIVDFLLKSGVVIRASGFNDFDADGFDETWLLISHHKNLRLELWIFHPLTNELLFIHSLNSSLPEFIEFKPQQHPPVFINPDSNFSFQLFIDPNENVVYPQVYESDYFWEEYVEQFLNQVTVELLSQSKISLEKFQEISSHPNFICPKQSQACAEFYTLRGLAYERNNDQLNALDDYYKTLINYQHTAFHFYSRLKLEPIHPHTIYPVSTPTITHTPTPSDTPTITFTPTTTNTPTITEEATSSNNMD